MDFDNLDNYHIVFKTVQSGVIRVLFETLKDILTDVTLYFSKDGIKVTDVDPCKVLIVFLKLVPDNFITYHCPRDYYIDININVLFKFIKMTGNSDTITFSVPVDDQSHLYIYVENQEKNTRTVSKVKLLELNDEMFGIPDVEYETVITLPSNDFHKICRNMYTISEKMIIESYDENIILTSDGDYGSISLDMGETEEGVTFEKVSNVNIREIFSLKHLVMITKSANLSSDVKILIKRNLPMALSYSVANLGCLTYLLAPYCD